MDEKEKIQAEMAYLKEVAVIVEASMGRIPEDCIASQQFALEQLKSELAGLEKKLNE